MSMTAITSDSDSLTKRSTSGKPIVSSKSLLQLKSIIINNVSSNSRIHDQSDIEGSIVSNPSENRIRNSLETFESRPSQNSNRSMERMKTTQPMEQARKPKLDDQCDFPNVLNNKVIQPLLSLDFSERDQSLKTQKIVRSINSKPASADSVLNKSNESSQSTDSNCPTLNKDFEKLRFPVYYARMPSALRQNTVQLTHSLISPSIRVPRFERPPRRSYPQCEKVSITKTSTGNFSPDSLECCNDQNASSISNQNYKQRCKVQTHRQGSLTTIETRTNECDDRTNHQQQSLQIREIMFNVGKRLLNSSSSKLTLVDTHCHFDLMFDRLRIQHDNVTQYFSDYREYYPSTLDLELVIQVFWRPNHLKHWTERFSKYLNDRRVYGSCGIHPHWSSSWTDKTLEQLENCLKHPKIVAIGEIGLDFGPKNTCGSDVQQRAFEAQLELAAKTLKPIVIHSRGAYPLTCQLLKKYLRHDHKIHLHCFVGTINDVDLFTSYFTEIKFGFTPLISRTSFLHPVLQQLELNQMLSETDSPYFMSPELSNISRCAHPAMVYSVVETIAELRQLPVIDVARQLRENARHIYGV